MEKEEINSKVLKALDEIRPFLQSDGGDISLVDITDDLDVVVKLHGACIGCRVNQMTLKSGVEMTIKKYLPQINRVVQEGTPTTA
jgi:Fe-S cluster biogenesis protein NfuA